jgi:hypothetical protein
MRRSRYCLAILYTLISLAPVHADAQKINTVEAVARLRASVQLMTNALPSVVCRERVISTKIVRGRIKIKEQLSYRLTVTRPSRPGSDFPEKRELLTRNGKRVRRGKNYNPIFWVSDGFGTRFNNILSPSVRRCFLYSTRRTTVEEQSAIEIGFRVNPKASDLSTCNVYEHDPKGTATFWVSADSGRLLLFRTHRPHTTVLLFHRVVGIPHSVGLAIQAQPPSDVVVDIDYHVMQFGPKLTVIPATVDATAILLKKPYIKFTYHALHSGCHRFLATVTLLPDKTTPPKD